MPSREPLPLRLGAGALAVSALLFAVFPLVRPFFRLDVFSPTLADVASSPLASPAWVIAHLLLAGAFALLPVGLLALYLRLAGGPAGPRALRGLVLALVGIALVVPAVGVETFAMPVLGYVTGWGAGGGRPRRQRGLMLPTLCGCHFRVEHQTADGEPRRDDLRFAHVAAWLPARPGARPARLVEPLRFESMAPGERSYR